MPEKSVRDMNAFERRRHALDARTTRAMSICCAALELVALIIGLGFYAYALSRQYIRHAYDTSRYAAMSATHGADAVGLTKEVMAIYGSLSPEERAQADTDEYRARFSPLTETQNYVYLVNILRQFTGSPDVFDVYVATFDPETGAMIYVAQPDEADPCLPGDQEMVSQKMIEKFLNWDGTDMLYAIDHTKDYGWLCTAGTPLQDKAGNVTSYLLVDVSIGNMAGALRSFALQMVVALSIVTLIMALFMAHYMRRSLVKPVNAIGDAALAYVQDRRAGVTQTDHFADLNVHTGDEVENLALIMADMELDLNEIEASLTAVTAQNERINTELSLATRIQAAFVPHLFPPFPDRPEFALYASMTPAKEVGGDFYDFFLVDDDHLALVMADVSGKGVPAALFMMVSKIILQSCAMLGQSPAEVLTKTTEANCSNNQEGMFVTVWMGILEISTGKLRAANAGHEYPVLRQPDGAFELLKDKHGFVIGGMSGVKYREYELQLEPGSKLFVYTDGVPEANNAENELFGSQRMLAALNEDPEASPEAILKNVRRAVDGFVKTAEQFDDLTMLCLEYKGAQKKTPMKELTLDATIENIETVTAFVNETLEQAGCPAKARMQVDMVIDEVFSNIAQYAYGSALGTATVRVGLEASSRTLILTFLDGGMPYNPLTAKDPDTSLSAEERSIGGLGIFLVKKTMDETCYEHKGGQNILTLKKRIP